MAYTITIQEPYAQMIAEGWKIVETRSWKAPDKCIGEIFYIHSGLKEYPNWKRNKKLWFCKQMKFNKGCIIAKAKLVGCYKLGELKKKFERMYPSRSLAFEAQRGFWDDDERWGWIFEDVEMLEPVKIKGHQRVWNFNANNYYTTYTK